MLNSKKLTKNDYLIDMKIQSPVVIGDSIHFLKRAKPKARIGFYAGRFPEITAADCVFLSLCKTRCDILVVAVESDYSARLKRGQTGQNEKERMFALSTLNVVDYICLYDEELPINCMSLINPDVVFTGLLIPQQEVKFIPQTEKVEAIENPFDLKDVEKKFMPLKYFDLG